MTGSSSGLLALGALGSQAHLSVKDEKNHHELDHRGATRGRAGVWAEALEALLWADTANAITLGPGVSMPWSHPSVKFLVHGNQSPIPQVHPPQSLKYTHSSLSWKTSGPFILEYLRIFLATSCPLSKGQPQSHSFRWPSCQAEGFFKFPEEFKSWSPKTSVAIIIYPSLENVLSSQRSLAL